MDAPSPAKEPTSIRPFGCEESLSKSCWLRAITHRLHWRSWQWKSPCLPGAAVESAAWAGTLITKAKTREKHRVRAGWSLLMFYNLTSDWRNNQHIHTSARRHSVAASLFLTHYSTYRCLSTTYWACIDRFCSDLHCVLYPSLVQFPHLSLLKNPTGTDT